MTTALPGGRVAAAVQEARRLGCGVVVVKRRDGSIDAHPDAAVDAGMLEISVAGEDHPPEQ